jgi:hypothetical protein
MKSTDAYIAELTPIQLAEGFTNDICTLKDYAQLSLVNCGVLVPG